MCLNLNLIKFLYNEETTTHGFSVDIAKFLKTPICKNICGGCF